MADNVIMFQVPLFNQLIGAIRSGNVEEITRIYFEMYPAEKPERLSETPAQSSEARPGVKSAVESETADEKGLASRVEELEARVKLLDQALSDAVWDIANGEEGNPIHTRVIIKATYLKEAQDTLNHFCGERALAGKKPDDD